MALNLPLYVETHGLAPGPAVDTFVLIHGYGGSSFTWRYWLPALAARGHVVLVDLKGFGAAPKPEDGDYGPRHQAELIQRLVLQRDLRNITLVGHSLGGGVALIAALGLLGGAEPRLARLVLVAGAAYAQKLPPFVSLARHPGFSKLLWKILGARRVVRWVLRTIVFDPTRITVGQVEGYAQPLTAPGAAAALIQSALQIVPGDLEAITARYRTLSVPTLLLWGRSDRVVPLAVGERLAAELPEATLVVLDACGHLPPEELPDESMAALQAFLDRTGDSRPSPPVEPRETQA